MTKRLPLALLAATIVLPAATQEIGGHYVSRVEADGTIYHTLPRTLFNHAEAGDLTFDLTYKTGGNGLATLNITNCSADEAPVDSLRLAGEGLAQTFPAERIYAEPEARRWRHRSTCRVPLAAVEIFFGQQHPEMIVYTAGRAIPYRAKRAAWRSYAPAGRRIVKMIRSNEQ